MRYDDAMDDINFCPSCGKNLEPGAPYCPACGKLLDGKEAERKETAAEDGNNKSRLTIALIMTIVNAAIFFIFGMYYYTSSAELVQQTMEMFPEMVRAYTTDALTSLVQSMAVGMMIFGVICVVTAALMYTRRVWALTFILCLLSALVGIMTIFGIIVGITALYMLYKAKPLFDKL
jgi:predicted RNA-binding Zn-ribbon protein involved in translation (DUF1610 family)